MAEILENVDDGGAIENSQRWPLEFPHPSSEFWFDASNKLTHFSLSYYYKTAFGGAMSAEKDEQTFENIKQLELVSQIKLSNPKIFGWPRFSHT